jgi:hypothetical protein
MASQDKKVQEQTQLRTGSSVTEELDWPIEAWQEAAKSLKEEANPEVLTTKDIRDHVLKLSKAYSSTEATREIIREWLDAGVIEVATTRRRNILGIMCEQRGFRLTVQKDEEEV